MSDVNIRAGVTPLVSDETLLRQLGLFLRDACEVQQADQMGLCRGGFHVSYAPGEGIEVLDEETWSPVLALTDEWLDTPGLEATR